MWIAWEQISPLIKHYAQETVGIQFMFIEHMTDSLYQTSDSLWTVKELCDLESISLKIFCVPVHS